MALVDFEVAIESGRETVILQLTDPQIIDSAQSRTPDRIGDKAKEYWATYKAEDRCYRYIRETVRATAPDLIIITGDLVYGEFDDKGTAFADFVEFMDSLGVPWAPVFGNHDNESKMGADWQCCLLENAKNCLFKQRKLTGNGNYSVGIVQGGKLTRVFYMLDHNCCGNASEESRSNGHTKMKCNFGEDQTEWLSSEVAKVKQSAPDVKLSVAFHLQPYIFAVAMKKYGFVAEGPNAIDIDKCENRAEGDFGYIGAGLKSAWDKDFKFWNFVRELGFDSIFVGHEHCNSSSIVYEGVRLQYGQKSSTYDRFNCQQQDGSVKSFSLEVGRPLVGGTVMMLSENNGTIRDAYIYLCQNS